MNTLKKCKCCKYTRPIFGALFIVFILAIIMMFIDYHYQYFNFTDFGHFNKNSSPQLTIEAFSALGMVFLTLIITGVAWFQLNEIRKSNQADFLMRIENSFNAPEINKVIKMIDIMGICSKAKCYNHKTQKRKCSDCNEAIENEIKKQIDEKFHSKKPHDILDRCDIKKYLDLLETIAYFETQGYLSFDDVKNIYGGIIEYHIDLFGSLLKYYKGSESEAYEHLDGLYVRLKQEQHSTT